jgi:pimeloyl-ACP methyl ester carboxylesterase
MSSPLQTALGAAVLLGAGTLLASGVYLAGVWRDTLHPRRRTAAWALANGLAIHPQDLGWPTVERDFTRTDGGRMPAWLVSGQAPHSGLIAVLLHGHSRSRWESLRRAAPWVERCALAVLPDLRGHGEAPGRSSLGRTEPADVVAMLSELAALHPGARFELVGHSLGAVVALHAAADASAAGLVIERVVAAGPYERVITPFEARLRQRGLPAGPFARLILAVLRALDGAERPTSASAARVRATVEVLADRTDAVSPAADAEAIARAAPAGRFAATEGVPHADIGLPGAPFAPAAPAAPPTPPPVQGPSATSG